MYRMLSYFEREPDSVRLVLPYFLATQKRCNLLLHGGNGGPADRYMSLKDFASYAQAQQRVSEAYRDQEKWNRMALMNIANSGRFAADRSIAEYAQNIWRVKTNFAF